MLRVSAVPDHLRRFAAESNTLLPTILTEANFLDFAQTRFWATCVEFLDPRLPGPQVPGALMVSEAPIEELQQLYRSASSFDEWVISVANDFVSADRGHPVASIRQALLHGD